MTRSDLLTELDVMTDKLAKLTSLCERKIFVMACIQDTYIQAFFYHNIYRKMKIEIKHIASLEMEY